MKHSFTWAAALLLACSAITYAGPKATQRPLPSQFFSEQTVVLTQVDVSSLSSAKIIAALRAIVPPDKQAAMNLDQIAGQMAMVDAVAGQLKAVGVDRLTMIGISGAADQGGMMAGSMYVLAPLDFDATEERKQMVVNTLQGLGGGAGMKAETIPGWVVLHQSPALPEVDELAIEDASFGDALAVNPDHDIAFVIVPTQAMRQQMAGGMIAAASQNATPEEREVLQEMNALTESEWYYISLVLGDQPQLRVSTKGATAAKAATFARAWASAQAKAKQQIREEMEKQLAEAKRLKEEQGKDYDPEDFDPQPMLDVVDAFNGSTDGQMMVVDMNRAELTKVVKGFIMMIESLGEAIGEAIAPI